MTGYNLLTYFPFWLTLANSKALSRNTACCQEVITETTDCYWQLFSLHHEHIMTNHSRFDTIMCAVVNTFRQRKNGRHFADAIFKCILLNVNILISLKISLKFDPKDRVNKMSASAQIMVSRQPGDKPLSEPTEPIMVNLMTHICLTWPQWVKSAYKKTW